MNMRVSVHVSMWAIDLSCMCDFFFPLQSSFSLKQVPTKMKTYSAIDVESGVERVELISQKGPSSTKIAMVAAGLGT